MSDRLYQSWEENRELMFTAQEQLEELGREKARAEAAYQATKARVALRMKADGMTATMIQLTIKGDPEVNTALMARDCAETDYESAKEALNVYKLDLRVVEAQIERENRIIAYE